MSHTDRRGNSRINPRPSWPAWFPLVTGRNLRDDFFAGLTGAPIVLSQGIAFAVIAGLPPIYGFYTTMEPSIIASLFGSSWYTVSGPTIAIPAMVYGAFAKIYPLNGPEFIQAAILLTLMMGLIQLAFAGLRLGSIVSFALPSVMTGFIAGAGVLMLLSQIDKALEIKLPRPEEFMDFFPALIHLAPSLDPIATVIALASIATTILCKRWWAAAPGYVIALAVGTGIYLLLGPLAAGHVHMSGKITGFLPPFAVPALDPKQLSKPALVSFAVALVGLLQTITITRAVTAKSGQEMNANREFSGQGLSNVVGSFFSAYPNSGSIARSVLNFEAGAKTAFSNIFGVVLLALILLFFSDVFAYVPIPAMAGVIMVVAFRLIDLREVMRVLKDSKAEAAIFSITFISSLLVDMEFAIYCGVILSILIFLDRSTRPRVSVGLPDPSLRGRSFRPAAETGEQPCPQLAVACLDGPLFFGSADAIRREFRRIEREYPSQSHLVFNIRGVGQIDLAAAELLIEEAKRRKLRGGALYVQTKIPRTSGNFSNSMWSSIWVGRRCIFTRAMRSPLRSRSLIVGFVTHARFGSGSTVRPQRIPTVRHPGSMNNPHTGIETGHRPPGAPLTLPDRSGATRQCRSYQ